jgi:serine/threonine-protein kinase
MSLSAAERTIRQNGLAVGKTTARRDPAKPNTVLSIDPAPGTKLAKRSAVSLIYSSGPGSVKIPAVVGAKAADAAKLLQSLGFSTRFQSVAAPQMPIGTVSGTSPNQGTLVEVTPDVIVTIDVVNDQTTVPELSQLSAAVAESQLTAADLQANAVLQDSKTVPDGVVFQQSVPAQSTVTRGSVITIVVSHNVKPTPTPTPSNKPKTSPSPSATKTPKGKAKGH